MLPQLANDPLGRSLENKDYFIYFSRQSLLDLFQLELTNSETLLVINLLGWLPFPGNNKKWSAITNPVSINTLAKQLKTQIRTLRRALISLKEKGLISPIIEATDDPKKFKIRKYDLSGLWMALDNLKNKQVA